MTTTCKCGHDEDVHDFEDGECQQCNCSFFEPDEPEEEETGAVFD